MQVSNASPDSMDFQPHAMVMDDENIRSSQLTLRFLSFTKIVCAILIVLSVVGLFSLATWKADDPSMTFAGGGPVRNLMGFWGASFADIAMQFFGLASVIPVFVILFWGIFGVGDRHLPLLLYRTITLLISVLFISAFASCVLVPPSWSLPVGLGGIGGDAVISMFAGILGVEVRGWGAFIVAPFVLLMGFTAFVHSCGLLYGVPQKKNISPFYSETPNLEFSTYDAGQYDSHEEPVRNKNILDIPAMVIGFIVHFIIWFYSLIQRRRVPESPVYKMEPMMNSASDSFMDSAMGNPTMGASSPMNPPMDMDYSGEFADMVVPLTDSDIPLNDRTAMPSTPTKRARKPVKRSTLPLFDRGKKFVLPTLDMLSDSGPKVVDSSLSQSALQEKAKMLEGVLDDFGIKGSIIQVRPGPVVTLYELEPAPGIKSSRIIGLADDIARSMSAVAARVAVIAGRNAIGIELPNVKRETVFLREQLASSEFTHSKAKLPMCLGKTIGGEPVVADMARMPHLLVAGTTGSGKSVAINTMILSLLYRHSPETCKLIMIDPKMLELSIYDGIPHLLTPVVTEPKKAVVALKWCVREMEERYRKMSKLGVRNIDGFNARIAEAKDKGESLKRTVQTGFDHESGNAVFEAEELDLEPMPFLVVVIDEMADLMMVAGKDIEGTVQRLAQMARAAGIHVIMATQRPSVDVITGTIKANFPTRISFQVTSKIDSRTILGEMGAEQLLGMGDMLYMAGGGRITRVHGPFVEDKEVEDVVMHLKNQGVPQYLESVTQESEEDSHSVEGGAGANNTGELPLVGADGKPSEGDLYERAVAIVLKDRKSSISYVQRRLSVGYNKAASFIERMEQEGIVSEAGHTGRREILVPENPQM